MSSREDEYVDVQALLRVDYFPEREPLSMNEHIPMSDTGLHYDNHEPVKTLDWYSEANCKGLTHLFFGPVGEKLEQKERREASARLICNNCVVYKECAQAASREYGYWAGTSEEERYLADRYRAPLSYSPPVRVRRLRDEQDRNAS